METKEIIAVQQHLNLLRCRVIYWTQQLEKAVDQNRKDLCFKKLEKYIGELAAQVAKHKYNYSRKQS